MPTEENKPYPDYGPDLNYIARRKLDELRSEGFVANGVAIYHPESGRRGLVDHLGYVGWQGVPAAPGINPAEIQSILLWWATYTGPTDEALGELVRLIRKLVDCQDGKIPPPPQKHEALGRGA